MRAQLVNMKYVVKPLRKSQLNSRYSKSGEGEVAFFSAKSWDRRNTADPIESVTPYHDTQEVGSYQDSHQLHLTILAAMSEDYTTTPQHLVILEIFVWFKSFLDQNTYT